MQMGKTDYIRGFNDALELVLLAIKEAKDVEDVRKRVEEILGAVVERKIEELARQLGYPLTVS